MKINRPNINEPIKIFGVEFTELMTVTGAVAILFMVGTTIDLFLSIVGTWFFLLLLVLYLGIIILLRFANRQDQRNFLTSFLAYYLFQPKHIRFYDKAKRRNQSK